MITLNFTYFQLLVMLVSVIATFKLLSVVIAIIFSSKIVLSWNTRRQREKQLLIMKNRKLMSVENLKMLGSLLEMINKSLANNHNRKRFYLDFALTPATREMWIKTLIEQNTPRKVKKEIKKCSGDCSSCQVNKR